METVGDQIFQLTKEVKELKARCRKYEELLRCMTAEDPGSGEASALDEAFVGNLKRPRAMRRKKIVPI